MGSTSDTDRGIRPQFPAPFSPSSAGIFRSHIRLLINPRIILVGKALRDQIQPFPALPRPPQPRVPKCHICTDLNPSGNEDSTQPWAAVEGWKTLSIKDFPNIQPLAQHLTEYPMFSVRDSSTSLRELLQLSSQEKNPLDFHFGALITSEVVTSSNVSSGSLDPAPHLFLPLFSWDNFIPFISFFKHRAPPVPFS